MSNKLLYQSESVQTSSNLPVNKSNETRDSEQAEQGTAFILTSHGTMRRRYSVLAIEIGKANKDSSVRRGSGV